MSHPLALPLQAGPLVVTLLYIGLYYLFQIHVLRVKTRLGRAYAARGEKFDRYFSQDREMLAADRIQLNVLEHMGPFLALLWLNATLVDPRTATLAGALYLLARAVYPLLMGTRLGRGIRGRMLVSTVPGYVVLGWLAVNLVLALVRAH